MKTSTGLMLGILLSGGLGLFVDYNYDMPYTTVACSEGTMYRSGVRATSGSISVGVYKNTVWADGVKNVEFFENPFACSTGKHGVGKRINQSLYLLKGALLIACSILCVFTFVVAFDEAADRALRGPS